MASVLVVDDAAFMRNRIAKILTDNGHEVAGEAENGKEAIGLYMKLKPDLVIFAISITRFEAKEAVKILKKEKINVSLINILWIKPFKVPNIVIKNLKKSKYGGVILDDDYADGISKSIANDLSHKSNKMIYALGLKNRTAGTGKNLDNLPPNAKEIVKFVKKIIKKN